MESWVLLREWAIATAVLLLTLVARATVHAFLRRRGGTSQRYLVRDLAPSLANLIYIVGFRVFAEVAPLNPRLETWLDSSIYVFAVIVGLGIFRRSALVGIEWSAARSSNSQTLQLGFIPLMRNLITLFVLFSGAIMILKRFNYDVLSLLTALGVGSLAVGLAAKDTLSNMISGFTLIIDRNFRPGDRINLGGSIGDVEEIGLRSTRLRTGDGNTLIVPNSDLVNTKILNLSLPSRESTATTSIKISQDTPFARVRSICLEIIGQLEKANAARSKWVNLSQVADGYQQLSIGFWVREMDDVGAALTDFNERLLERLKRENITLFVPPAPLGAIGGKN